MRRPPARTYEQIADSYRRMAAEARYRPAAPSDGMYNIPFPEAELDIDAEIDQYAQRWWQQEDALTFHIGACNFPTRPATIFAIEAARSMCGTQDDLARDLLRMALAELDAQIDEDEDV